MSTPPGGRVDFVGQDYLLWQDGDPRLPRSRRIHHLVFMSMRVWSYVVLLMPSTTVATNRNSKKVLLNDNRRVEPLSALHKTRVADTLFESCTPFARTLNARLEGTNALVDAGYPAKLVDKAVNETEELQPLALRVRNAGGIQGGE